MSNLHPLLHLAERSSELFFTYDFLSKRFTYMNPMCISFFDLESADVDYKVLLNAVHAEDQKYVLSKFQSLIEGDAVADVECRIKRGPYERWLRITPHMFYDNGESMLLGQAEDITVYKAKTEALNNHNNKKNSVLNILAHDLAGPIGTVESLSTLLALDAAKFKNPTINRYISMINKISKSSIKLIHDFVDHEFLESAGVQLLKTRVNLVAKIGLAAEEYLATQKDFGIHFSCHSSSENVFAEIDEDKFMQVIKNLISNALKFTPEGGFIAVYVQELQKDILISVADSGIGIPQRYHSIIFDKFSDARRPGLNGEASTGLGMSIIKTIVEWHNGKIWFESQENKGTTFYIQIPKG